jgi:hypothetical protein
VYQPKASGLQSPDATEKEVKMKNKKLACTGLLSLLLLVYALSYGANYKMVCDDLDQTGLM